MGSILARARRCGALWLLVALAAGACGERAAQDRPGGPGREVTLADGNQITVHSRGLRVFPASSSVVDFLVALAPPERVVALPEQALDYSSLPGDVADWKRIPQFSVYIAEEVIAHSPDLVIAEPWQDVNTSERLREAGLEVVVLPEVRSWKEARATLLCVGSLLELDSRAQALVRDLDLRVAALAARPGPRRGLRVLCYSNFGSGWSAGDKTTIHEQIVLAGMRNAVAEAGREGHVQISFEELIDLDPDLILVSKPLHGTTGTDSDLGGASRHVLETEPSLRGLRAVKQGHIVALPPNLFASGSQSIVAGAEALAAAVDALLEQAQQPAEQQR